MMILKNNSVKTSVLDFCNITYLNVSGKYFQFVNSSVKAPNLYTTKTAL